MHLSRGALLQAALKKIPGQWQHTEDGMIWDFIDNGMLNGFGKFRRIKSAP